MRVYSSKKFLRSKPTMHKRGFRKKKGLGNKRTGEFYHYGSTRKVKPRGYWSAKARQREAEREAWGY